MTAPVWIDIADVSPAQVRRQNALFDMHQQWVAEQVADGVDGPVPPGRKAVSDYNQHVPDLEASGAAEDEFQRRAAEILRGDLMVLTAAADVQTGAMVALVPAEAEAVRLASEDGEPADQLHMTGLHLGEAADWTPEERAALLDAAQRCAASVEPFTANGFALSMFHPGGDNPCVVLGMSGAAVADFYTALDTAFEPFAACMPEQYQPRIPHMTLMYTDDPDWVGELVDRAGPVVFDRLRVAFGGEIIDMPLGRGDNQPMTAAVGDEILLPPVEDVLPEIADGTPWEGVLAPEGVWSGDGRQFAPGSLEWAPLPLALKWQPEEDDGHDGSVIVGRIDEIWRDGAMIRARGVMDDDGLYGAEALRLMRGRMLRGVSIRGDNTFEEDVELVFPAPAMMPIEVPETGYAIQVPDEPADEPMDMPMPMMPPEPMGEPKVIVHKGRIRSATLCPEQAFVEAEILLTDPAMVAAAVGSHDTPTSDRPWDGPAAEKALPSPMPVATARAFYAWIDDAAVTDGMITKEGGRFGHHDVEGGSPAAANIKACQTGIGVLNGGRGGTTIPGRDVQGVYDHLAGHLRDAELEPPPLTATTGPGPTVVTAAAYTITIPELWPEWWFDEPAERPPFGALHITPEGRVFGLLAPGNVAHRAFRASGRTVTAPRGLDYSEFMNKAALVAGADGEVYRINAGTLTFDCGHPSPYDPRRQDPNWAMQQYDNTCSVAARVRAGEYSDGSGTWVAGALLHGIDADTIERMMACALSVDVQGGKLNAALLVPVEGFPAAVTSSVRVREGAMVASSMPIRFTPNVAASGVDYGPVMERLARSIGRDRSARFAALRDKVKGGD